MASRSGNVRTNCGCPCHTDSNIKHIAACCNPADYPQCDDHRPIQHRDGKPPWCHQCLLTEDYKQPVSIFDKEKKLAEEKEDLHHDENTLRKVYKGLMDAGIYGQQAVIVVQELQKQGILFRERKPKRRGRPPKAVATETAKDPGPTEIGPQNEADDPWSPVGGTDAKSPDA